MSNAGDSGEITVTHLVLGIWSEKESAGHKILESLGFDDEKAKELSVSVSVRLDFALEKLPLMSSNRLLVSCRWTRIMFLTLNKDAIMPLLKQSSNHTLSNICLYNIQIILLLGASVLSVEVHVGIFQDSIMMLLRHKFTILCIRKFIEFKNSMRH